MRLAAEIWIWFDFIIRYLPGRIGELLRTELVRRRCKSVGSHLTIGEGAIITGYENVKLGSDINIMRHSSLSAHNGGYLEIGNNISINFNVHIGAADNGKIIIGNNVMIGQNVVLRASGHGHTSTELPMFLQGHVGGCIIIEDDVWIGANAVVLPNVRIGCHSIVGAGAVVTCDVEPYSVVAGVPAVLISKRR